MKGKRLLFIFLICSLMLLASCFQSNDDGDLGEEDSQDNEVHIESPNESSLRILIPMEGQGGQEMLQHIIETYLPELNYEFVFLPSNYDNLQEIIEHYLEEENIDVLSPGFSYKTLAERGYLYPLDHLMEDADFKLEELHPGVVQQHQVDGEVFGMSPSFHTHAIYYNKDLFDQLELDYPTDQMTWGELLELAAEVKEQEEEVTGLKVTFPFIFFQHFAVNHDLGYFVEEAGELKLEIDNEDWQEAWELIQHGFEEGYLDFLHSREPGVDIGFVNGEAAMAFADIGFVYDLRETGNFDWDMVTEPVHPSNRNESISLSPFNPLSINSKSDNVELAWQVVKAFNSSEVTAELAQEGGFQLFSRTSYINVNQDFNANAFFSLQRGNRHYDDVFKGRPIHFDSESFTTSVVGALQQVIDGRISVEEALENLQDGGERLFYQAINKESGVEGNSSNDWVVTEDDEEYEYRSPFHEDNISRAYWMTR